MKRLRNISGVTLLAFVATSSPLAYSQSSASSAEQRSSSQRQQTTGQARTDENIGKAVRDKLQRLDGVDISKLNVETNDGTATITGTVNTLIESERILEAVSGVRGVRNVITQFTVTPEKRADSEIQQDVRDALAFDPVTADAKLNVKVDNAVVTLSGSADTWSEKLLAGWLASDISGVREIRNEIKIADANRSDSEIKAAVERRFATDPLVSDTIKVEVANGKVTLSGEVGSVLEKNWAMADARTRGVREVDASALRVDPNIIEIGRQPAGQMTDEKIKEAITDAYINDPRVYSFNPRVHVDNGVVTLTGTVSTLKAKQMAVQIAENTAGVKEVKENLALRADRRSDEQIAQDIRRAYDRSLMVDANQIKVEVKDGTATLTGAVDSYFEKWSAADIVARTRGVKAIENRLAVTDVPEIAIAEYYYYPWHSSTIPWTVSPSREQLSDTELAAAVRNQLFWSPFTDAEDITVTVNKGVVTLTGQVEDRLEKGAAADNAYQAGAKRVENRLSVLTPTGR